MYVCFLNTVMSTFSHYNYLENSKFPKSNFHLIQFRVLNLRSCVDMSFLNVSHVVNQKTCQDKPLITLSLLPLSSEIPRHRKISPMEKLEYRAYTSSQNGAFACTIQQHYKSNSFSLSFSL